MDVPLVDELQSLLCSLSATKRGISLRLLNKAAGSGTTGAYREEKGSESFFLIPGCSKRSSSKAARSGATEAYPEGTSQGDTGLRTKLGAFFSSRYGSTVTSTNAGTESAPFLSVTLSLNR